MNTNTKKARTLRLLMMCASPSLWAASPAPEPLGVVQVGSAHRDDIRRTVERHRNDQREEIRREELAAGRRLTASELLELRTQVRQQSQSQPPSQPQPQPVLHSRRGAEGDAEAQQQGGARAATGAQPAPPLLPTSARWLTMPRSQRQP